MAAAWEWPLFMTLGLVPASSPILTFAFFLVRTIALSCLSHRLTHLDIMRTQ